MKKTVLIATAIAVAAFIASPASAEAVSVTGEIAKVDGAAGKVTIKQDAAKALDMPDPMTMVYRVKDPAALKLFKAGDAVKFDVDRDADGLVVTGIKKK